MYPNPLIYCTCWDPWNLGPRKLIKTPRPPNKTSPRRSKLTPLLPVSKDYNYLQSTTKPVVTPKMKTQPGQQEESNKLPNEVINVSPGYKLIRNREQISVTLGEEMFGDKKQLESKIKDKVKMSRTNIISDLEEQISELTAIIEQMNRDHQSAQKLLSNEMDLHCAEMQQNFESKSRELKEAHEAELSKMENEYKAALKAEKLAAQEKLEEVQLQCGKPCALDRQGYAVLPCVRLECTSYQSPMHLSVQSQDSIYDEMEDKWSKRKAEWEKDEKLEREKILLQQKHRITKKFELESEEEKKRINESYNAVFENFIREKEVIEEEVRAQALMLESLNTNLYQTQMELQREKAVVGNMEKTLQTKLAEAEDKYKYTIQILTEENIHLRQKIIAKNEEIYEERSGKLTCTTVYKNDPDILEDGSNKGQEP
ncbi:Amyotrophic lateral sclerosis 2 chromosomal region candidate 12 protein [Tupaia chinensis]|uniref:Amyotrophic lateral sclerosis 2 chromosomal region candidate 12 protein n=1 Tax=Tupaia chinensis TaxID=246437 RepID=L9KJL8_TUPCH|nr:Amyotrophic lateral sclerosis 2 chromosomal region candidate 12 protein [Tupaia chinensis]